MSNTPAAGLTFDERLMAGLAHLAGVFLALLIWIIQKDRSRFIRFQALQAAVYDGISMLAFMGVSMAVMLAVVFIPFGLAVGVSQTQASNLGEWLLVMLGLAPLSAVIIMLGLFVIWMGVRVWAAVSVFQGANFQYPVIGRMLEKSLAQSENAG